jgi:hypothetical protein
VPVRDRFLRLYYVHMGESGNNCTMCFEKNKIIAISLVMKLYAVCDAVTRIKVT